MMSVKEGQVSILEISTEMWPKINRRDIVAGALADLKMDDEIEITHLKFNVWPNRRSKMNSTSHTRVKVSERALKVVKVEVIGLSEEEDMFNYNEYKLPSEPYMGTSNDLLGKLPMTAKIEHCNLKIVKFTKQ